MTNRTIRDIERQANLQAGVETEDGTLSEDIRRQAQDIEDLTYASIARTLAYRYDSVYYVNIKNNHYIEYISSSEYRDLEVETSGEDFFEDSARNIRRVVHEEDQAFALRVHQKEYMLKELEKERILSFTYRIMFDGVPHYYNGRISKAGPDDQDHLIIGWANVDSQVQLKKEFETAENENRLTKNINKALTSDYVRVYYVNLDDDSYIQFTPDAESEEFTAGDSGADFFKYIQIYAGKNVYRKDLELFGAAFYKDNILSLMEDTPFILTYRLMQGRKPVWHTLKALFADKKTHMLVAIRNIDVQKRLEAEYESKLHSMSILVNRDAMTSVKNKNAFNQEESKWDQAIRHNEEGIQFAIVVCDVNDLKRTNDTLGHKAGDELIISASRLISNIFKHSPVFRIGGDEFAVVLSEHDYDNQSSLMGELEDRVRSNVRQGGVVIASGMASYEEERDQSFTDVFKRADESMYENKRLLKKGQG